MALKEVKPCSKREQKGSRNWTNLAKYGWSRDAGLFLLPELGTVVIYSLPKASVLAGTGTRDGWDRKSTGLSPASALQHWAGASPSNSPEADVRECHMPAYLQW